MKTSKRYAFLMKPGCGPTIEGLLVGRTRREFVLIGAEVINGPGDVQEMGSEVTLLRENVFCLQEIR